MEHFAHIFIGKEFAEIVSNIGRQVCKYGGEDILSSVKLFVVDDNNIQQLFYPESPISEKNVILQDASLQMEWRTVGKFTGDPNIDKDIFISKIFNNVLRIGYTGAHTSLYTIIHFPLYKSEVFESVKLLYKAIKLTERPVELNFMGYCDDMSSIIEPDYEIVTPSKNQVRKYVEFRDAESIGYNTHFIIMQNTSKNGISLGLTADSFATVLFYFSVICANYYHEIFPNTVEYMDAVAFGLSSICLDKYLYTEYLLNKTMLNSMEQIQVNDDKVDANSAYVIVNGMLEDRATLLSSLFSQLDKQQNYNEDKEFSVIQESFSKEVQEIVNRCNKTLSEQKAITMQAAILAASIAKTDCELFSETIFSQDIVTVDKLFNESIDYFINNDRVHYYKLNDKEPVNPIPALKKLDTRLINSETTIRNLKSDLEKLNKQIGDSEKATDFYIEDGCVHFKNHKFRLLPTVVQEPLVETYTAHGVKVRSLDMRSKFTAVKDQGQQGSCLSFALTSIFEYVMQLNAAKEFDLSEAFLYYNARNLDENDSVNEDSGSCFKPAIDSLVKYGIALEKVWPYNEQVYSQKPSEEAYADAAKRKLVAAMNVNLKVEDIKSALVDNCPVAASFTLTKSFFEHGRIDGYIPMPGDEEIASISESNESIHGRHAMVIVGFSDELQMFIVRNSWGADWGDKGYCYIPYSYIEHEDLMDYACILTEIENLTTSPNNIEIVPLTIDSSDLNIQYAIKNNELYIEEHVADKLRKEKNDLRIYFESLKQMYCNPNQRNGFVEANKEELSSEQESLRSKIKEKESEHDANNETFKNYKKDIFFRSVAFFAGTVLLALIYKQFVDALHFILGNPGLHFSFKPFLAWAIVYAVFVFVSYFIRKKTFVKSFWMSLWGVVGVLAAKTIYRLLCYFIGNDTLTSYFNPKSFFPKIDGVQFLWLFVVFAVAMAFVVRQGYYAWRKWRDERDRINFDIKKLQKEINNKEREKELLKLKTFSAWTLITKLQDLQTRFYSHYTNLISLINNFRVWYKELETNENKLSLSTAFPDTSLLAAKLLDEYFEKNLKDDPELMIDFCADISNYKVNMEAISKYKESLNQKVIDKLLTRKEIRDFDISNHIANNAYPDIAVGVNRELVATLDKQSGIFLSVNSKERGMIVPSTAIFAPSLGLYHEALRRKLGKYSEPYFENFDKYRLVFLKTATVWFRECVNLY